MAEDNKYIVDIGEEQGNAGHWVVTATARDGSVEKAVFSGKQAPSRALAYVEAMGDFEKRPPLEYPKMVRRNGAHHLVLDKKHEESFGDPSDADKEQEKANSEHLEAQAKMHKEAEDAHERLKSAPMVNPKPERFPYGEDDSAYAERLAKWQDQRRGEEPGTNKTPAPIEPVGRENEALHANTAFETDSTKIPTVEGMKQGEEYKPVDHVHPLDGVHAGANTRAANAGADAGGAYPGNRE